MTMGIDILALLRHLASAKREQWMDADSLERLQSQRLSAILESSRAIPAYAASVGKALSGSAAPMEALRSLPVVGKRAVQASPESFLHPRSARGGLTRLTTSGSTGIPLQVFLDSGAMAARVAQIYAVTTEFGRSPFDVMATLYERPSIIHPLRKHTIFRELPLSIFSDERDSLARMSAAGASIVSSFPSVIASLAHANAPGLGLKAAYCTGETLTPRCRKEISESFGCEVFDQYGLNEAGLVAWECPEEHRLHINSGSCIVEVLDDAGKPARRGAGEIVVTSLISRAMPFIRYSTGDRGRLGGRCRCGRGLPVLEQVEGRKDDLIVLPSGRERSAAFIDALSELPELKCYQLVQESESRLLLRYVPAGGDIGPKTRQAANAIISRGCLGEPLSVEFERVERIGRSRSGKIATVLSRVRRK